MRALSLSEPFIKSLFPYLSVFFFIILGLLPWPTPFFAKLFLHVPLLVVCYWVVNRPDLFGKRGSFLAGLLQDFLQGHMLGLMAFSYLAADYILRAQHDDFVRRPFVLNWAYMAAVLAGTTALQWVMVQFFTGEPVALIPLFYSLLPALLVYPLLHFVLFGLQRAFTGT